MLVILHVRCSLSDPNFVVQWTEFRPTRKAAGAVPVARECTAGHSLACGTTRHLLRCRSAQRQENRGDPLRRRSIGPRVTGYPCSEIVSIRLSRYEPNDGVCGHRFSCSIGTNRVRIISSAILIEEVS